MTPDERNLISGLFDRLRAADAKSPAKDAEADTLIRDLTAKSPSAPYLLTQTLLVQEHALSNAQARIQALERQVAQAQQQSESAAPRPSFLSGWFGNPAPTPAPRMRSAPPPPPDPSPALPYPSTTTMAPSAGGGFLRSALTTAAGVAGGAMLFQGIENLLGHNAGPFGGGLGGGLGGGSFLGGGGGRPDIVENNYYNEGSGGHQGGADAGGSGGGGIPAGAADQPARPGSEDAGFDDSKFDSSNPFDQPTSDSSLFNTPADNSSLDNNFDLDNTDAGNSSDFSGGNDFAGGDNFGSDDSGSV